MYDGLVSVIIPVHNAERFIEDTIASVKSQSYENWEVILVDDASEDGSARVIGKYLDDPRFRLVSLEKKSGPANARNEGLDAAKGRFIAFLDADDIWFPDKLSVQLKFMEEHDCPFSFTSYEYATPDGVGVAKIVRVPARITYREAIKNTTIFTSTVIFDRDKLDESLMRMPDVPSEDSATWWQVLRSGITGYGLTEPKTLYRRSDGTLSSNKITAIKRVWNLYRNVEHFNVFYSAYCFFFYAVNAVFRRL